DRGHVGARHEEAERDDAPEPDAARHEEERDEPTHGDDEAGLDDDEGVRGEEHGRRGHGDPEVVTVEGEPLVEAEVGDQPEDGLHGRGPERERDPVHVVDARYAQHFEGESSGEREGEAQARQQHPTLPAGRIIHGSAPRSWTRFPYQNSGPTLTSIRQPPSLAAPMATRSGPTGVGQMAPSSAPAMPRVSVPARSNGSSTAAARRRSRAKPSSAIG